MKDVRILGVDLGKNSCSIVGLEGAGRVLLRRRTAAGGGSSRSRRSCRAVLSRWRRAAEPITSGAFWLTRATPERDREAKRRALVLARRLRLGGLLEVEVGDVELSGRLQARPILNDEAPTF